MKTLTTSCILVLFLICLSDAKETFHSFSIGLASPINSSAPTSTNPDTPNEKTLKLGWDAGWTFFGKPFLKYDNAIAGLSFGGKISFSRWVRDSTLTGINFLGTQLISRYYLPMPNKQIGIFVQGGAGFFIGEHGFKDPDTLNVGLPPSVVQVTKGKWYGGYSLAAGFNWDIFEIVPSITIVGTKITSSWFAINAAVTF